MNYISLNFSPLVRQAFVIDVFRRKAVQGEEKKDFLFNVKQVSFINGSKTENYWITFVKQDGFENYQYDANASIDLTKYFLHHKLVQSCQHLHSQKEYFIVDKLAQTKVLFVLAEFVEGWQTIEITPYYLAKTKKFGFLFNFKFISAPNQQFNRRVQQLSLSIDKDGKSNVSHYADRYQKIRDFAKKYYHSIFKNSVIDFVGFEKLPSFQLENKTYIFAKNETHNSQFLGLHKNSPYKLPNQPVNIYFLYTADEKELVLRVYDALTKGVPQFPGFESLFKISFKPISIKVEKRFNQIPLYIQQIKNDASANKIVISFLKNRDLKADTDWYYQLKYQFTNQEIPIQFLQYHTVRNGFAFPNIALQIFAKVGGIPWIVKPSHTDSLVIGLSQSYRSYEKDGNKLVKYFAYSVLLNSSGLFKELKVLGNNNNKEAYLNQIKAEVINMIEKNEGEYKKIVIHTPFKTSKDELAQIKKAIKESNKTDVTFIVLRINTQNAFWGFQENHNTLIPYESTTVAISENEYLVWFEGLKYNDTRATKRFSGPTYIQFYYSNKELSFEDKKSYLQEVINLSGANWRGFNAKSLPVSIYYCQIINDYIVEFKERDLNELNISNLNPWFL